MAKGDKRTRIAANKLELESSTHRQNEKRQLYDLSRSRKFRVVRDGSKASILLADKKGKVHFRVPIGLQDSRSRDKVIAAIKDYKSKTISTLSQESRLGVRRLNQTDPEGYTAIAHDPAYDFTLYKTPERNDYLVETIDSREEIDVFSAKNNNEAIKAFRTFVREL